MNKEDLHDIINYDFMICGYYLYFTSHCIIEAMHVRASDKHLTESCSAKLFPKLDLFKAHSFSRVIWTPLQAFVPASA